MRYTPSYPRSRSAGSQYPSNHERSVSCRSRGKGRGSVGVRGKGRGRVRVRVRVTPRGGEVCDVHGAR